MSDTRNIKLGVCQVFLKGVDLGYTKGGVEVSVTTETHATEVDQFGKSIVNEFIMGRSLKVKVPMVETTLENMAAVMPGAVITEVGGTNASGTITITTNPSIGTETITVNGVTVTFKTALTGAGVECLIGADASATAANLAAALNASNEPGIALATYSALAAVVTVKYGNSVVYGTSGMKSTEGNAFTLVTGTAAAKVTMSAATLTGGTNSTGKKIAVPSGVGTDLLAIAKELRLHPVTKAATDLSDDFIIPLAATGGAVSYAYKVDDERVYPVEFTGYPDPVTKNLFLVGGRA